MVQNNQKEKTKAAKKTNTRKSGNSCGLGVSLGKPMVQNNQKEKIKAAKKTNTFSTRECSSDAVKPDGSDTSVKSKISKAQIRHLSEAAIVTLLILSLKKKNNKKQKS